MSRKPKMTHRRVEITVAGTGRFPLDMLRYDQCAPRTLSDATAIHEGEHSPTPYFRVVNLNMYIGPDNVVTPAIGRWESFGWYVLTTDEIAAYHADPSIDAVAHLRDALALRQGADTAAGRWPRDPNEVKPKHREVE